MHISRSRKRGVEPSETHGKNVQLRRKLDTCYRIGLGCISMLFSVDLGCFQGVVAGGVSRRFSEVSTFIFKLWARRMVMYGNGFFHRASSTVVHAKLGPGSTTDPPAARHHTGFTERTMRGMVYSGSVIFCVCRRMLTLIESDPHLPH